MKVTPRTKERKQVDFAILKSGDAFLWRGGIWVKGEDNQIAVNLSTGEVFTDNCGEYIAPVDATIHWKYKETKKKK